MCADQLWNLRVFWLGIPIIVLHELFVKLVQNLPKKMGDFNFFLTEKAKNFENLWKKPGWSVPKDSLRGQWNKKVQHRKNPKDLKSQQNAIIMGQRSHQMRWLCSQSAFVDKRGYNEPETFPVFTKKSQRQSI